MTYRANVIRLEIGFRRDQSDEEIGEQIFEQIQLAFEHRRAVIDHLRNRLKGYEKK
jgi:enamine deaminase RidA (YjgF/YER057c/UK114 family)